MTWPKAELGAVCDIVSGATPKTGVAEFWDGDIAWTTPKDLSDLDAKYLFDTPRKLTESGLNSCSASMLPANSVLLSSRAPIGLVAINTIPLCTNQGFKNLIPHKGRLDPEYLYWWLKSQNRELQNLGRGATFKEISKAIVSRIQIPLPPLAEQKRIAGILDAADALRAKRRESIEQLDTLIQSTFLEMFGDPVTNPMGWDKGHLGDFVPCINVGHVGPTSHGYVENGNGVVFLRTQNVRRNKLDLSNVLHISASFDQELKKSRIHPRDVLVSRVGVNRGMAAVVPSDLEGANCANIVIVRSSNQLNPAYLSELINGPYGRLTLLGDSVGAAQGVINVGTLLRWSTLVPPLNLQNTFATYVDSVEQENASQLAHLAELDTLFASLQSRAFRGEL